MKHHRDPKSRERDDFPDLFIAELLLLDLALKLENEEFADNYIKTHNIKCVSPDYPMNK